jgi:hypothetical protein
LFLISCDPGIRDIYTMVKIYDRADFPSRMSENLKPLLDDNLIYVAQNFDNGTANKYAISDNGKSYLDINFNNGEIIEYIKTLDNPDFLLRLTQTYIDKKTDYNVGLSAMHAEEYILISLFANHQQSG